jgi:hypothetical protein
MTRYLLIAALACAGVLSLQTSVLAQAAAPRAAPAGQACLRQRTIYDFQLVPGNRSLVVTDLARQRYRLNFIGKCYNIQHQFGLRFKTFGVGTLSCVDKGDSVLLNDPVGPNQCIIQGIEYQTPALDRADYAAALAAKQR